MIFTTIFHIVDARVTNKFQAILLLHSFKSIRIYIIYCQIIVCLCILHGHVIHLQI